VSRLRGDAYDRLVRLAGKSLVCWDHTYPAGEAPCAETALCPSVNTAGKDFRNWHFLAVLAMERLRPKSGGTRT
jgi:hypothetical protein